MKHPLCKIVLDGLRAIEMRDPQVEGMRMLIRFRAQLEALANLVLHPDAKIDSLHDELIATFEEKLRELEASWKNCHTTALINLATARIKNEKARVLMLA